MKSFTALCCQIVGVSSFMAACSSAPTHYHTLAPIHQPPAGGLQEHTEKILLAHLTIPAEVDRMQLVVHEGPTRLRIYESERWGVSLRDQISAILTGELRELLPGTTVTDDPLTIGVQAPLRLNVDVEEFDASAGAEVAVRLRWEVSAPDRGTSQVGQQISRQRLTGTAIDAVVLAWSRAMAEVSSAMAASISQLPGQ